MRGDFQIIVTTDAGNEGIDSDANGTVDANSIKPPSTAKNCITIGASIKSVSEPKPSAHHRETARPRPAAAAPMPSPTATSAGSAFNAAAASRSL